MKQEMPQKKTASKTALAFIFGLSSAVLGITNNYFPNLLTVISVVGALLALIGIVFAIIVRKANPNKPPLLATLGLMASIVGLLWNLVFFVACSSLACGSANMF